MRNPALWIGYCIRDRRAVDQIQCLRQAHIAAPFAFTSRITLWASEQIQETTHANRWIGELLRPKTLRDVFELQRASGGHADGIEERLRWQTSRQGVREINFVTLVPFIRAISQLIGPRVGDGANQVPQIEIVICQILSQRSKQRFVTGRITGTNVVHWIDDASAKEITPDAVCNGLSKIRIVLRCEPTHQVIAPVAFL